MPLILRPGLHYRRFDDIYVFFDLTADRYFLLTHAAAESFGRFVLGAANTADHACLLAHNLLAEPVQVDVPGGDRLSAATASLVDTPRADASLESAIASIWAQKRARRDLRRRSLSDIVGRMGDGRGEDSPRNDDICGEVAAAFLRARRYVPAIDQCLVRGIAMKRMLTRRGCTASLVFGVTMPFAAHCWVQAGQTVLTDPLDLVRHYQPIFAV